MAGTPYTNAFRDYLNSIPSPTDENPLAVLFSACLTGVTCGYDGTAYGNYPQVHDLLKYKNLKPVRFCPENASFGTPRDLCNIHGGDGMDVLNDKARIYTEEGLDWTDGMIAGAKKMLECALENNVKIAVMMDISAACGSQVIYYGDRLIDNPIYQKGMGVATAVLRQNGILVISQRDFRSLQYLFNKLDPAYKIDSNQKDHNESDWYVNYFKAEN